MSWWSRRSIVQLPAREAYDRWAPAYHPIAHNPLMRAEQEAVVRQLHGMPMARVLDAGGGTGRYTRILREHGAAMVVSLDWSREMLRRQIGGAARVCGDARVLPFANGTFDLVNASLMAGDIPNLGVWLLEVARVLAPGGHVVYSDFHPGWHARGWQRTFRDVSGRTIALGCYAHTHEAHLGALADAGLCEERIDEVTIIPQRGRFNVVRPRRRSRVPALVVVSAMRPMESLR